MQFELMISACGLQRDHITRIKLIENQKRNLSLKNEANLRGQIQRMQPNISANIQDESLLPLLR